LHAIVGEQRYGQNPGIYIDANITVRGRRIDARDAIAVIGIGSAFQDIVSCITEKLVVAGATDQVVITFTTADNIIPIVAGDSIVSAEAGDDIIAIGTINVIVPLRPDYIGHQAIARLCIANAGGNHKKCCDE